MSNNPIFWSSVGFWILMVGLGGDFIVLFIPSGRTEKRLAAIFTVLIAIGVFVEHVADAKRFGSRVLSAEQQADIAASLKPLSLMPDPKGIPERADIVVFPLTSEGVRLSNQIVSMLQIAGWNANMGREEGSFFGRAFTGVSVFAQGSPKGNKCAAALTEQLNSHGITATFDGPVPKWPWPSACTADVIRTDPACSMLLLIVGDHP